MRRLLSAPVTITALVVAVMWWRHNRRAGSRFMNRVINPFLLGRGVAGRSHATLGILEHIGRRSGTRRRTVLHPVPNHDGFRIVVPLGEESQWARNVLAAGHCRLQIGDMVYELGEPELVEPAVVSEVAAPLRWVQAKLGFRWLLLRQVSAARGTLEWPASLTEWAPVRELIRAPTAELVAVG